MGLNDIRPAIVTILFGVVGIILAGIEKVLYDRGVLLNEISSLYETITITDLMICTIIIWLLIGIVYAVIKS